MPARQPAPDLGGRFEWWKIERGGLATGGERRDELPLLLGERGV